MFKVVYVVFVLLYENKNIYTVAFTWLFWLYSCIFLGNSLKGNECDQKIIVYFYYKENHRPANDVNRLLQTQQSHLSKYNFKNRQLRPTIYQVLYSNLIYSYNKGKKKSLTYQNTFTSAETFYTKRFLTKKRGGWQNRPVAIPPVSPTVWGPNSCSPQPLFLIWHP